MMAVLPLWCASTLVAYLLGQLVLGPKSGFASLVMLGGFASAALLGLAGHPLPGIVIGAVSGGVCGAALVRWAGTLRWSGQSAEEPTSTADEKNEKSTKAKTKTKKAAKANEAKGALPEELRLRRPAADPDPEPEPELSDVTGPLVSPSKRPKETPAAKASAARSGSYSAAKTGKKSKRKKSKRKKPSDAKPVTASLEEESEVAIGTMLEETMGEDAVNRTAALGTVSRAEKTMAGFDAKGAVVNENSPKKTPLQIDSDASAKNEERAERLGRSPSSIPRGVFAMDEETPIALTHQKPNAGLVSSEPTISGFDDPTENLDSEIAPTHCPRCREECTPEARYCAGCSAPVMPWKCKECGHHNHAEADFCVRCQAPVELLASPVDVEILNE
ncbi:MAG: zinc ribbon domain-containing protein [Polyangiales bacterium]